MEALANRCSSPLAPLAHSSPHPPAPPSLPLSAFFSGLKLHPRCLAPPAHRIAHISVQAKQQSVPDFISSAQRVANSITGNAALRNAAFLAMNTLLTTLPALAEEEEKGKIFDFNLTLPIIAAEFLLLMVTLDNIWFKPVSKVMDERDEAIRQKLMGVRDNSGEIKGLQEEAEAIIKAARAETTGALNKMKRETAAALDEKLRESRERIEKELATALANLEVQKEDTLKSLDKQVQALSEEILQKVLPFKI